MMRRYDRVALLLLLWAGTCDFARSQEVATPGQAHRRMLEIIDGVKKEGQVNGFQANGLDDWARQSPLNDQPVMVASNLPKGTLRVYGVEIEFESITRTPSIYEYCGKIKAARANPIGGEFGLIFLDYKWSDQLRSEPFACRSEQGQFVFIEVPIAVKGIAILTRSADQFPAWITPEHFAVAALESLPERVGTSLGPIMSVGKDCKALDDQPTVENLQSAINEAECLTIGEDGKRKIGQYSRVSLPARHDHADDSLQDFTNIHYGIPSENNFPVWNYYDDGLEGRIVNLHVMEESAEINMIHSLCKIVMPDDAELNAIRKHMFLENYCKWRTNSLWKDYFDKQSLADMLRGDSPVVYTPIGAYFRFLLGEFPGAFYDAFPISFSSKKPVEGMHPVEVLQNELLDGEYPLAQIVWMYADPAIFAQNRKSIDYVYELLANGGDDHTDTRVEEEILFFGQLNKLKAN